MPAWKLHALCLVALVARASAECCVFPQDAIEKAVKLAECTAATEMGYQAMIGGMCDGNRESKQPECFIGEVCYAQSPDDCCKDDYDPMVEFGYHLISTAVFALIVWSIVACSCIPGNCCNGGCCCSQRVERNPALCQCRGGGVDSKSTELL